MNTPEKKDKNRAFASTVILHAVLLAVFVFFGLSVPHPLPEEHGVLVVRGYMEEGAGERQPLAAPPPDPRESRVTPEADPEAVVTQDTEESVPMPDEVAEHHTDRERPDADRHDHAPDPEDAAEEEPEEEPLPEVDPRALFPGRDQRSTDRQDQGETVETGDEGMPEGAIDADEYDGTGPGDGIEYTLDGRQANFLPLPDYTTQATGRVVVQITVNRRGQVIRATAGARGTTTTNQTLHRIAEEAARRARFDLKADAPEEQIGTITYNFIRRN